MAVTENNRYIRAVATSGQTVFNYDFEISEEDNITILHIDSSDTVTTLTLSTDYTLTDVGESAGGTFVLTSGATEDDIYVAYGNTPYARSTDFSGKAEITTDSINNQYDNLVKQVQQIARDLGRTLRFPLSDNLSLTSEFGVASERAGKYILFDASDGSVTLASGTTVAVAGGSDTQVQYNNDGLIAGDSGTVTDGSGNVDITGSLDVDNININGNTISSTNANANINLTPNGTGIVNMAGSTEAFRMPVGTTAQRPSAPDAGYARFNSDDNAQETFDGSQWITQSGGSGDVTGPGSSTDDAIATYNGTGGTLLQDTSITIANGTELNNVTKINDNAFNGVSGALKNKVVNGDFTIWERGLTFTGVGNGDPTADRWRYNKTGPMVHDVTRETDVPTASEADYEFNFSLKLNCTTADASVATNDLALIRQPIEGYLCRALSTRDSIISFWAKATKTGVYCITLRNSGFDRSYVAEYTVNASDTWEKKTISVLPFSAVGGTWDFTTGRGLDLTFVLSAGTSWHTTAGSWQTGSFLSTSNQVNACDTIGNSLTIAGVHFEVGDVATQFEDRSGTLEYMLCKRYYERVGGRNAFCIAGSGQCVSTTSAKIGIKYIEKRASPSISLTNDWAIDNASGTQVSLTGDSFSSIDTTSVILTATVASGLSAGDAANLISDNDSTAELQIDAEI